MIATPEATFNAIVVRMAADMIEQMAQILDGEGIEIEPMEVKIEGESIGHMDIQGLAGKLREISSLFRPISMTTTRQEV